jgi:hypothetical protein
VAIHHENYVRDHVGVGNGAGFDISNIGSYYLTNKLSKFHMKNIFLLDLFRLTFYLLVSLHVIAIITLSFFFFYTNTQCLAGVERLTHDLVSGGRGRGG